MKNWLKLVESLAPIVLASTPLAPAAPFVAAGIKVAESIPGASGPQKLELAKQVAKLGVQATNAKAPGTIDELSYDAAVDAGIGAVIAAVNAKDRVKSFADSFKAPK